MNWIYPVIWAVLVVVFVVLEANTVQLISIWLGLGALAALVPALLNMPFPVQAAVFIIVAGVCLIFTRPFVKNILSVRKVSTNADKAIGAVGLVTETIDNALDSGRVTVDGVSWRARSEKNTALEAGSRVRVLRIEGVTVFVQPMNE